MINVIVNGSTLVRGGALQAYVSFYYESMKDKSKSVSWYFVISKHIYKEINEAHSNNIIVVEDSPAKNRKIRSRLLDIEKSIKPNIIFTFFGPAYVQFNYPHLCGVANPWVTHSTRLAFSRLPMMERFIKTPLRMFYRAYWFRKANEWVVETEVARKGLINRLNLPGDRIHVVPNTCAQHYIRDDSRIIFPVSGETIKILCFSAYYPHKNLEIIPFVAKELSILLPNIAFEFVLTLPENNPAYRKIINIARTLGIERLIKNIGPVPVVDGPDLYRGCHIVFLPTVLETFTANYPEAMASSRPIVTTNLDFARNVCRDAAQYFNPTDPADAAKELSQLIIDKDLWITLVQKGKDVLDSLPKPYEKYLLYKDAILKLYDKAQCEMKDA